MDRDEVRMRALRFLYTRFEAFGSHPNMLGSEELAEAAKTMGVSEEVLRRAFRELVEDGLAEGHPRPGTGMHPEDGLVWISPAGRRSIEDHSAPTRGDGSIELVLNRWRLGAPIGAGGFGRVFEATSGDEVAVVKFVQKLPGADRELLFADLDSAQNVIPIIDSGETESDWVLVMPRADRSLEDRLATGAPALDRAEAIPILIDIATALESLHGRVVHRDLKPANILLYQGHWCLADFGTSRYADATTDPATRKFAMTPPYAAPEQWRHERATSATDVYAFGVIAFRMLSGRLPFDGPGLDEVREQHLHGSVPSLSSVHPALAGLAGECLYKAPEARPTPANILNRLRRITLTNPSAGIQRLQAASLAETARRGEHDRQGSAGRSEAERRASLADAAGDSLRSISTALRDAIMEAAPAAQLRGAEASWTITLGSGTLTLAGITRTPANPWGGLGRRPRCPRCRCPHVARLAHPPESHRLGGAQPLAVVLQLRGSHRVWVVRGGIHECSDTRQATTQRGSLCASAQRRVGEGAVASPLRVSGCLVLYEAGGGGPRGSHRPLGRLVWRRGEREASVSAEITGTLSKALLMIRQPRRFLTFRASDKRNKAMPIGREHETDLAVFA